ncbi:MAG: DNA polymerase Y family protein [Ginsengibacter sp.]
MQQRFIAIWFRHLKTDRMIARKPQLKNIPFVLVLPDHGRMRITEASAVVRSKGITNNMLLADARIIFPAIEVIDDNDDLANRLLKKIALWCIRFTPVVAVDLPNGIILDTTGCTHLWGSEEVYLKVIINRLKEFGFHIRAAMADTIGAAWAISRYGKTKAIIETGKHIEALMNLPAAALRLDVHQLDKLHKLGLHTISSFMNMQRSVLRRRFGEHFLLQLDYALGNKEEIIQPVIPVEAYHERLHCMENIQTKTGIEIALKRLLEEICRRLQKEGKGLRRASFKAYRIDDKTEEISIVTNHASNNTHHLFKLFELKIATIEPALGIELFTLDALKVEDIITIQETFWTANNSLESIEVAELLDNLQSKFGNDIVHRYLPDEHHLPERSVKEATSLKEKSLIEWRTDKLRPIQLLHQPQRIEVTAPIPDYPPMNFTYKGKLHKVLKADACERIEAEWWIDAGLHRDYYIVEDEEGKRYWLYRLGHYTDAYKPSWFLHGFFA